ncbi:MAG: PD-(D/E)XK nuclease domain-containing protein, partial [bacterium]|nr:PD-(D/E)XK nuclease domain-containing protein [bacterium]
YNTALAGIPYEDFMKQSESLYRALFLMLLRGAGISANGELHTCRGRSDLVVTFPERVVVLEFKLARRESEIEGLKAKELQQIEERGYAAPYDAEQRAVNAAVVVAEMEKRQVFWQISS